MLHSTESPHSNHNFQVLHEVWSNIYHLPYTTYLLSFAPNRWPRGSNTLVTRMMPMLSFRTRLLNFFLFLLFSEINKPYPRYLHMIVILRCWRILLVLQRKLTCISISSHAQSDYKITRALRAEKRHCNLLKDQQLVVNTSC